MSKEFKRCPRCNTKTPIQLKNCGGCGLNYDKFNSATNTEAKSAFRMGEKDRVIYTKTLPSDVNKVKMFIQCLLGGWFGLHYFKIGRIWRGLIQILGAIFAFIYSYSAVVLGIASGYLGYLILICGFVWVYTFITWLSDSFAILFNKFKYPVSLPYSNSQIKLKQENQQIDINPKQDVKSITEEDIKFTSQDNQTDAKLLIEERQEDIKMNSQEKQNVKTDNKGE